MSVNVRMRYQQQHASNSPPPIATLPPHHPHSPAPSDASQDRSSLGTPPVRRSPHSYPPPYPHHYIPPHFDSHHSATNNNNSHHHHHRYDHPYIYPPSQFSIPTMHPPSTHHRQDSYHPYTGPQPVTIVHTDDAATKLSDRVRRRCFNCCTTDTSTWRRSNLSPGKVVGFFSFRLNNSSLTHARSALQQVRSLWTHSLSPPSWAVSSQAGASCCFCSPRPHSPQPSSPHSLRCSFLLFCTPTRPSSHPLLVPYCPPRLQLPLLLLLQRALRLKWLLRSHHAIMIAFGIPPTFCLLYSSLLVSQLWILLFIYLTCVLSTMLELMFPSSSSRNGNDQLWSDLIPARTFRSSAITSAWFHNYTGLRSVFPLLIRFTGPLSFSFTWAST